MTIAIGVSKLLAYKAQSALGTQATNTGGQLLRRVTANLSLAKDTYESNEINPTYQVNDFRHGARRVEGTIEGELSPLTYNDFYSAVFRKAWAATTVSGSPIAMATHNMTFAVSGSNGTLTRATGTYDFLTSGIKVGDTVRFGGTSSNDDKNFTVLDISATVLTFYPACTAEGPISSGNLTITVPGKKVWIPDTGHAAATYFTIEQWFSDVSVSEQFLDMRVGSLAFNIPATGIATVSLGFMGRNMVYPVPTSQYFGSASAITTSALLTGVSGSLMIGTTAIATVTGLQINVDSNLSTQPVLGSNQVPDIFQGRIRVSGQATMFFENKTYLENFINEDSVSLIAHMKTDSADNSEFLTITLPKLKFGGASKDDGEQGLIQTLPFVALLQGDGGSGTKYDKTSIVIHDSQQP